MAVTFRFLSSTASALTMRGSGLANQATAQFEINRAEDFTSDDSITITVAKTAGDDLVDTTIGGLPSGTPWFGRVRNVTTKEVSASDLLSTAAVPPITVYAGYSINKAMLVVPQALSRLTTAATPPNPGYPLGNMLRDAPSAVTRWDVPETSFDFTTSGEPVDTIALLGTSFNDDAFIGVYAYQDEARMVPVFSRDYHTARCSPTIGRRPGYHVLERIDQPVTARYWRIFMLAPGASMILVRNLVVGLARASTNADKGASYGANDLGSASRTRFGVLDAVRGWRGKTVSFAMSWLSETEFQAKWADLPGLVGTTKSVLAIPNSKRNIHLNDRIAFGTITQMGAENVQSFKYSQSIEINSIY